MSEDTHSAEAERSVRRKPSSSERRSDASALLMLAERSASGQLRGAFRRPSAQRFSSHVNPDRSVQQPLHCIAGISDESHHRARPAGRHRRPQSGNAAGGCGQDRGGPTPRGVYSTICAMLAGKDPLRPLDRQRSISGAPRRRVSPNLAALPLQAASGAPIGPFDRIDSSKHARPKGVPPAGQGASRCPESLAISTGMRPDRASAIMCSTSGG